jgi:hypothetical protein
MDMKKLLIISMMILGLTVGCASTGNDKDNKSNAGENIPEDVSRVKSFIVTVFAFNC